MDEFLNEEMPAEDYLIQQLKDTVERRRASMGRIKDAYANDPRSRMTPLDVGIQNFVGQPGLNGFGIPSYAPLMEGMANQRELLLQNKIQPELLQQKFDETDPFEQLYRKVVSKRDFKPDVKVVGSSLVKYDPSTDKTQVLFSDVKNSPLYGKIWDQIHTSSLNDRMQFKNDAERRAYVTSETNKAFADAVSRDSSIVGPQTGATESAIELPKGPLTDANQTKRPTPVGITPAQVRPTLANEKALRDTFVDETLPGRPIDETNPSGNIFGKPVHSSPDNDPRFAGVTAQPTLKTVRDLESDKKLADADVTDYQAAKDTRASLQQMNQSLDVMAQIINSGEHTSGPAHEFLNKLGGYVGYIDPTGSLAKMAGNDAVYFSNMMNLVRDKIKALGSGTAVSNLDLIVTQKSVGDLRNTPEGNKKLLAIMALQNATMGDKLEGKLQYFENNKKYEGYRGSSEPTHIVRRSPNTGDYWVQSREDWIQEQVKAKRATEEEARRAFNREAVSATARLINGTGIKMGGR